MLVLTRQPGEEIMVGDEVRLKVISVVGNQVRLGVEAPQDVAIFRREIYDEICRQNLAAAQASPTGLKAVLRRRRERTKSSRRLQPA